MSNHRSLSNAFSNIETSVTFSARPAPIPADLRVSWRLAALVLILSKCRAGTANLEQLNVLSVALRSAPGRELLLRWFNEGKKPDEFLARYDPAIRRTIDLAVADGLVVKKKNLTYVLTATGRFFSRYLADQNGVMVSEKQFLASLPSNVTQKSIRELLAGD